MTIDFICRYLTFSRKSLPEKTFSKSSAFLSFREGPAIVNAFWKLKTRPDLLLIDGAGINLRKKYRNGQRGRSFSS
ncbi:MAG: endonuclease V [Candidatus Methanoperedens sp.]|nr:endonuclease V [Candidatus Methanoperedens sp.]